VRMERRAGIAFGILLACCRCASALSPSLDINQYAHTAWTVREAFFKGTITSTAQTPGGYLWLATEFGLIRFDGSGRGPRSGDLLCDARAHQIEAEIRYDDRSFRLRIRDDGKRIDPGVLEGAERLGHWGLLGIRDRAKRIGARLDFWSEAGAGTEVELTVPASVAYAKSSDSGGFRFFRKRGTHAR